MGFGESMSAVQNAGTASYNAQTTRLEIQQQVENSRADLIKAGFDPDNLTAGGTPSTAPGGAQDTANQQNQILQQNMKALQGKLAVQDSDAAVINYASSGDATQLQKALNNNTQLKQAWGQKGVQNVTNLNYADPNDQRLLAQQGIQSSAYNTPDKAAVMNKNVYKYYDQNNVPHVGLLNNVVQQTGAIGRVSPQDADMLHQNQTDFYNHMAGPTNSYNTAEGSPYKDSINKTAQKTGVPPNLIASMMNQEQGSSTNPGITSSKGAVGPMQVTDVAAKDVGMENSDWKTNPDTNILVGGMYMAKQLQAHSGNTQLALASYNAGPGAVQQHNGVPPYPETQKYVNKIMNNWKASQIYTQGGQPAADAGNTMGAQPTVTGNPSNPNATPNPTNNVSTIQNFMAPPSDDPKDDQTISTIQKWNEGNAMAAAGTDPALAHLKIQYEAMTNEQKNNVAATNMRTNLVNEFGGEGSFMNTNFDPSTKEGRENFNDAMPKIEQYAKLQGTPLSDADKATVQEARGLMAYAGKAVDLADTHTGPLGQYVTPLQNYVNTNLSQTQAASAYKAMNIAFQHAMDGSRVTPLEQEQQDQIAGDLGDKAGPLFAKMANIFGQIQTKINSVSTLNDPYVAKVMLGSDLGKADKISQSIQDRIDMWNGNTGADGKAPTWQKPDSTSTAGAAPVPGANSGANPNMKGFGHNMAPKKSLDDIFKGQ